MNKQFFPLPLSRREKTFCERKSGHVLGVYILLLLALTAPAVAETVSFNPGRGLVEVQVTLDGRVKGTFGIDTGADRLYIDSSFAFQNGLTFTASPPQRSVVGIDGTSGASTVSLRSLRIGSESLYNLEATAINMKNFIKEKEWGYPDGLIGYSVLRRFYVTVDYPKHALTLDMSPPSFLRNRSNASRRPIRFSMLRHFILVDVTFNNEVTVPMILDYCASYTSITPSLARRIGIAAKENSRAIVPEMSVGKGLSTSGVTVLITDLSDFQNSLRNDSFEGIIGATFLAGHKLTIDYKARRLYVHE